MIIMLLWQVISFVWGVIIPFDVLSLCAKTVFLLSLILIDWKKNDYVYLICGIALLISTHKGKAWGALFLLLVVLIWVIYLKKRLNFLNVIFLICGCAFLARNKIYEYYFWGRQAEYPRAMLLEYGVKIATEHFPLGTGWGTFNSFYAALYYSPIYEKLGWKIIIC